MGHVVPGAYRTLEDLAASCSHIAWGVVGGATTLKVGTLSATLSTTGDDLSQLQLTIAGNPQPAMAADAALAMAGAEWITLEGNSPAAVAHCDGLAAVATADGGDIGLNFVVGTQR